MNVKQSVRSSSVLAGFVGFLIATPVFAQNAPSPVRQRIGMGVSVSDVGSLAVAGSGNTPVSVIAPTIFVPINVTSRFRVEPEVGIYRNSSTTESTQFSPGRTRTTSTVHVGTAAFALTSTERFTVYYGARVAYLRFNQSEQGESGVELFTYPTFPGFFVAPAVGGEYFLADHLSLGGEVQVRYTSSKASPNRAGLASMSATTTSTQGAFVLRFYFPGSTH